MFKDKPVTLLGPEIKVGRAASVSIRTTTLHLPQPSNFTKSADSTTSRDWDYPARALAFVAQMASV